VESGGKIVFHRKNENVVTAGLISESTSSFESLNDDFNLLTSSGFFHSIFFRSHLILLQDEMI